MITILNTIQSRLSSINTINYLNRDWGQLDNYNSDMSIGFPAVLIDVGKATYTSIGNDYKAMPAGRQQAQAQLTVTIADLRTNNDADSDDPSLQILQLMDEIHQTLHGFVAAERASALIRSDMQRSDRTDGLQEYKLNYSFTLNNI